MKRYLFLVLLVPFISAGCSTVPKNARPFSMDILGEPNHDTAIVVVYRDNVPPLAYDIRVNVNNKPIAKLPNEGFTWTRVPVGTVKVELDWPFIAATPDAEAKFQAEAEKLYFVEATGGVSGFIPNAYGGTTMIASSATQQSYTEAVAHLRECCRYVPGNTDVSKPNLP